MIEKHYKIYFIVFIFLLGICSCKRDCHFSEIPNLEFSKFEKISNSTGIDNQGYLKLNFTDGDGDIGLKSSDTLYPYGYNDDYYYNFFIDYYEKQNGVYVKIDLPLTNNSRLPVLSDNSPECLSGEISIKLSYNNILSQYDTICFKCYIVDRALNKSNIVTTPDIIVSK